MPPTLLYLLPGPYANLNVMFTMRHKLFQFSDTIVEAALTSLQLARTSL